MYRCEVAWIKLRKATLPLWFQFFLGRAKTEELSQASMKLGEIAYRKAQEEAAGDEQQDVAETVHADEDEVIEADFTDLEIEDENDEDTDENEKSA